MKRLLLFLTLLGALPVMAQTLTKSYTFNFSNPETLNPSVTPAEEAADEVPVPGAFTSNDGVVSIDFYASVSGTSGVSIRTGLDFVPYLNFGRFTIMQIKADGAEITSVRIPGSEKIGAVVFHSTVPESEGSFSLNSDQTWHEWDAPASLSISQVNLINDGQIDTRIQHVVVDYKLIRDRIKPLEVSPAEGEEITSFRSMDLTFGDNMSVAEDAAFTLKCEDGTTYPLTATLKGKVVTLSLEQEISTLGNYTLTVKAGSLVDGDGFANAALEYHFTIVEPVDTFNPVSLNPEEGTVDLIPNVITLSFPDIIGFVNQTLAIDERATLKDRTGKIVRYLSAKREGEKDVVLTFDNELGDVQESGKYTLSIPSELVYSLRYDKDAEDFGVSNGARYNKALEYTYIIGENIYPSSEVLAEAEQLLEDSGVGYPADDSDERAALSALVESGLGSDAAFNAAIDAYRATSDVTKPSTGNYYRISSVSSNGQEYFLKYDGIAVSLTNDNTEAAAFKATANEDGTTTFATLDGKYLHLLTTNNTYSGTTPSNLTDQYDATVNDLKLDRLAIEGYEATQTYGLFSIYGCLGNNAAETPVFAYALINAAQGTIATDPMLALAYFNQNLTNAFRITEFDKSSLPVPDAVYTLSPVAGSSVDLLSTVTITFPEIEEVTLADATKIYLKQGYTAETYPAISVARVAETKNSFVVNFGDIPAGPITVVAEKGAFTYVYEQTQVSIQTITGNYTVLTGVDFIYDFATDEVHPVLAKYDWLSWTPIHDVDINDVTFYSEFSVIKVNGNSTVLLKDYNSLAVVNKGVFVETTDPELPYALGVIKIKLDKPITANSIPSADYVLEIPAATFGDANFGKYLAGDANVKKSDCHVNEYKRYHLHVDNAAADATVGIAGIRLLNSDARVYDLQGRRMEAGSLRPGIYVKDGRKFVVK